MQSSPSKAADHPCSRCAFYDKSIWQPVGSEDVASLTRGFSRRVLAEGQLLFRQGEDNRGIFCVSSGLVALRCHHLDGSSTLMRLAYPGEIIGYRAFLSGEPHQTEARALLPSKICTVTQGTAQRLIAGTPEALGRVADCCLGEINRTHQRIIAAAKLSNKQRLAVLLRRLMASHGTRCGDEIQMRLPLSRMDLADLIGVQPETMSRLVKRLEADGVFCISRRDVRMKHEALKAEDASIPPL